MSTRGLCLAHVKRETKRLALIICAVALVVPISACGGDSASDEEIEEARQEGQREGRNEQRLDELEQELRKRERERRRGGGTDDGNNPPPPPPGGGSRGSRDCGGDLSANSNTSCDITRIVKETYQKSGQSSFEAYNPVNRETYRMSCTSGSPHVCTGGNNAAVYFP